ncbi:hypothetical protein DFH08DRAFT_864658 [Mycena albidolilacea]|uniref:Uncharacterized protein n=1 Tax=Mycena albidolilacea TaxID=1033008 RepID=A0AAD7A466_9AGAR|nr:hypothetical protein DFH08DRAFT_864658 [Mycena albidolilacea]
MRNKEKNRVSFPFLGWGAGCHPCVGMRATTLEIKLVIALFLLNLIAISWMPPGNSLACRNWSH